MLAQLQKAPARGTSIRRNRMERFQLCPSLALRASVVFVQQHNFKTRQSSPGTHSGSVLAGTETRWAMPRAARFRTTQPSAGGRAERGPGSKSRLLAQHAVQARRDSAAHFVADWGFFNKPELVPDAVSLFRLARAGSFRHHGIDSGITLAAKRGRLGQSARRSFGIHPPAMASDIRGGGFPERGFV